MADATAKAETAQALFCAIADYVGVSKLPDPLVKLPKKYKCGKTWYDDVATYKAFKQYYRCVLCQGKPPLTIEKIFAAKVRANASFKEVEKFLEDTEWYLSSLRIAVELLSQLGKISKKLAGKRIGAPGWKDILYWRAAQGGVMGTIEKLYKEANASAKTYNAQNTGKTQLTVFNDPNKWSPADIYWSTEASKTLFEKELETLQEPKAPPYSFGELNDLICEEIEKGSLLPLSLKKNAKGAISIVLVNFEGFKKEQDKVSNLVAGALNPPTWKPYKGREITGCIGTVGTMKGGERKLTLSAVPNDQRRDVVLFINKRIGGRGRGTPSGQYIKFRHVASGPGAFKCQIFETKTGPAAGALGETGLGIQMDLAGKNKEGNTWASKYKAANKDYLEAVRSTGKYSRARYDDGQDGKMTMKAMSECKAMRKAQEQEAVKAYIKADTKLSAAAAAAKLPKNEIAARYAVHAGNLSGRLVANVSCKALVEWLVDGMPGGNKPGRTDKFVQYCYLFATSRSESSARFVIGK